MDYELAAGLVILSALAQLPNGSNTVNAFTVTSFCGQGRTPRARSAWSAASQRHRVAADRMVILSLAGQAGVDRLNAGPLIARGLH